MKRHLRIMIILVISMFLFNINEVNATPSCPDSSCNVVCQYRSEQQDLGGCYGTYYNIIQVRVKKDQTGYEMNLSTEKQNKNANQIQNCSIQPIEHTTPTIASPDGFNLAYADVSAIPNFSKDNLCAEYGYVYQDKNSNFLYCFDNDGKYCKNKCKDNGCDIIASGKKGGKTVNQYGETRLTDDEEEAQKNREELEKEALKHLEEQRVLLKKKQRKSGSDCDSILGPVVTEDVNKVLKYMQYIGPILVIVLGILDFIKAVASGSNETFSSAWKRLLKRLIVAILLFFVVILVKFLFHVFGITAPDTCLK